MYTLKKESPHEIVFEQGGGLFIWLISLVVFIGLAAHSYSIDNISDFELVFLISPFFILAVFKRSIFTLNLVNESLTYYTKWFGIPYREQKLSFSQVQKIVYGGAVDLRYIKLLSEAERKTYYTVKFEYSGGERSFRLISVTDVIVLFEFIHKKTAILQFFEKGVGGPVESLEDVFSSQDVKLNKCSKTKFIEEPNRLEIYSVPFTSFIGLVLGVCFGMLYFGLLLLIYVILNEPFTSKTIMFSLLCCTVFTIWLASYAYLKTSLTATSEVLRLSIRGWFSREIPLEQVKGCVILGSDLQLIFAQSSLRIGKRFTIDEAQFVQNWLNKAKSKCVRIS
ncbi:hypothetical protein ACUR5C_05465 [Aliikangiella sp. IMCC44653]